MKKIILIFAVLIGAMMLKSVPVLAATTISLSPNSINVREGQVFNVVVYVNPQGVGNYTVKSQLSYPNDLLVATSFSFASGWMALSQPGYDLIDNNSGSLIKTAGYAGGFSSNTQFGTVSFKAKKSGTNVIKIGNGSLALDASGQNVYSATGNQVAVSISASASKPTTILNTPGNNPISTPASAPLVSTNVPTTGSTGGSTTTEENSSSTAEVITPIVPMTRSPITVGLAFASVASLATSNGLYGASIAILLVLIGYLAFRIIERKKKKVE